MLYLSPSFFFSLNNQIRSVLVSKSFIGFWILSFLCCVSTFFQCSVQNWAYFLELRTVVVPCREITQFLGMVLLFTHFSMMFTFSKQLLIVESCFWSTKIPVFSSRAVVWSFLLQSVHLCKLFLPAYRTLHSPYLNFTSSFIFSSFSKLSSAPIVTCIDASLCMMNMLSYDKLCECITVWAHLIGTLSIMQIIIAIQWQRWMILEWGQKRSWKIVLALPIFSLTNTQSSYQVEYNFSGQLLANWLWFCLGHTSLAFL